MDKSRNPFRSQATFFTASTVLVVVLTVASYFVIEGMFG